MSVELTAALPRPASIEGGGCCANKTKQPLFDTESSQIGRFATFDQTESARQTGLVQALQGQIDRVETGQRSGKGKVVSSGCPTIDRLLPGGGYSPGTLVQWFSPGGYAADYLSLLAAVEACSDGGGLVVVDPWRQFYPPALAAMGFDVGNLIILRSDRSAHPAGNDLFWAVDQALRCPAVGAVWGPMEGIDERWFRRFQLSAESSGCLGVFVQSMKEAKQPSWAEVQWSVGPAEVQSPLSYSGAAQAARFRGKESRKKSEGLRPSADNCSQEERQQQVRLELLRCRGALEGQAVQVAINAITGEVR